jgi:hypothetical protein
MTKKLTFVVAPAIPLSERDALEKHFHEAFADPDYTVVTNYEVKVANLEPEEFLLIAAPNVPPNELFALRAKIDEALAGEIPPVIVVNYDIDLNVIPTAA